MQPRSAIPNLSLELTALTGTSAFTVNHEYADQLGILERLNASGFMPPSAKMVFDSFELMK
jgi:hypothetical protein